MELKPGAVAILYRTFSQRDFDRFAALSGDDNPIHVDAAFASRTRFGRTVCHGMLLYSTICRALTDELGPGFAQQEQELMFVTPTYTGEEVAVRLEVTALLARTTDWPTSTRSSRGRTARSPARGERWLPCLAMHNCRCQVAGSRFQVAGYALQPSTCNL